MCFVIISEVSWDPLKTKILTYHKIYFLFGLIRGIDRLSWKNLLLVHLLGMCRHCLGNCNGKKSILITLKILFYWFDFFPVFIKIKIQFYLRRIINIQIDYYLLVTLRTMTLCVGCVGSGDGDGVGMWGPRFASRACFKASGCSWLP